MTTGTAYGTKMPTRRNLASQTLPESRISAKTSARISMIGTWMSMYSATRLMPSMNAWSLSPST